MTEQQQSGAAVESVSPDDLTLTEEYQVMGDLGSDDDTYQSIKVSIETDGFDESTPIIADAEGNVLDGHHRLKAARAAGVESVPVVRKPGLSDEEKREEAYAKNMQRRNLDDGAKRAIVEQYLKEEFTPDQTQAEVANILGVSDATVTRARNTVEDEQGVDLLSGEKRDARSNEEKRTAVREHLRENPDTSDRAAAEAVDVGKSTVARVRGGMEDEKSADDQPDQRDGDHDQEGDEEGGPDFNDRVIDEADTETGTDATHTENAGMSTGGSGRSGGSSRTFGGTSTTGSSSAADPAEPNSTDTTDEIFGTNEGDDSDGDRRDVESESSEVSQAETKQRVRDVLVGAKTPLTLREVTNQVAADEGSVRTALSGLVNGPAERSPRDETVWWVPDTAVNVETRLKTLSNELDEPITVGDRVYEDGDAHPLDQ